MNTYQLQHPETKVRLASPVTTTETNIRTMNLALKSMGCEFFYVSINASAQRNANPTREQSRYEHKTFALKPAPHVQNAAQLSSGTNKLVPCGSNSKDAESPFLSTINDEPESLTSTRRVRD